MTDPRKQPGYKQTRIETRIELLLGAILDRLTPKEPTVTPLPSVMDVATSTKRRKKDQ